MLHYRPTESVVSHSEMHVHGVSRFWSAALPQSHTRAATILIDELDAAAFQSCAEQRQESRGAVIDFSRSASSSCTVTIVVTPRFVCEILLAPAEEARAALDLCRRSHAGHDLSCRSYLYSSIINILTLRA